MDQIIDHNFRSAVSSYFQYVIVQDSAHEDFRLTKTSLFILFDSLSWWRVISFLIQDESFKMSIINFLKVICRIILNHHVFEVSLSNHSRIFRYIKSRRTVSFFNQDLGRHHDWIYYRFEDLQLSLSISILNWYNRSWKILNTFRLHLTRDLIITLKNIRLNIVFLIYEINEQDFFQTDNTWKAFLTKNHHSVIYFRHYW